MGFWKVIAGDSEGPIKRDLHDLFLDLSEKCHGDDLQQQEVSVAWYEDENEDGIIVMDVDRIGRPDRFGQPKAVVLGRTAELEIGLDEAVKVVRQNASTICSLRVKIADLDAQIAALKDITISERERRHVADMSRFGFVLDSDVTPDPHKIAKDQLTEEYPEIFR